MQISSTWLTLEVQRSRQDERLCLYLMNTIHCSTIHTSPFTLRLTIRSYPYSCPHILQHSRELPSPITPLYIKIQLTKFSSFIKNPLVPDSLPNRITHPPTQGPPQISTLSIVNYTEDVVLGLPWLIHHDLTIYLVHLR